MPTLFILFPGENYIYKIPNFSKACKSYTSEKDWSEIEGIETNLELTLNAVSFHQLCTVIQYSWRNILDRLSLMESKWRLYQLFCPGLAIQVSECQTNSDADLLLFWLAKLCRPNLSALRCGKGQCNPTGNPQLWEPWEHVHGVW